MMKWARNEVGTLTSHPGKKILAYMATAHLILNYNLIEMALMLKSATIEYRATFQAVLLKWLGGSTVKENKKNLKKYQDNQSINNFINVSIHSSQG